MYYKLVFLLLIFSSSWLLSQPRPDNLPYGEHNQNIGNYTKSGIWHKNMELITPIDYPGTSSGMGEEQFQAETIQIAGSSTKHHYVVITASGVEYNGTTDNRFTILLYDVENPYNPTLALKLTATGLKLLRNVVWSDIYPTDYNNSSPTNHTFSLCQFGLVDITSSIKANSLIFDLSEALKAVDGNTDKRINIEDITVRNSIKISGSSTLVTDNPHIYIGYVRNDPDMDNRDAFNPYFRGSLPIDLNIRLGVHDINVERVSGLIAMSGAFLNVEPNSNPRNYQGYVDMYQMASIPMHANYNSTSATAFVEPVRLLEDGKPIKIKTNFPISAHETDIHRMRKIGTDGYPIITGASSDFENNMVMISIAGLGGGAVMEQIDYTPGSSIATCTLMQTWEYDPDRANPSYKISPNSNFGENGNINKTDRVVHTIEPVHINKYNHFFITSNENVAPQTQVWDDGGTKRHYLSFDDGTDKKVDTHSPVWHDGSPCWLGNDNFSFTLNSTGGFSNIIGGTITSTISGVKYKDDRDLGNYYKIWGSSKNHSMILGLGTNETAQMDGGPISSYEVPEQDPSQRVDGGANFPCLSNEQIHALSSNASTSEGKKTGPNSAHHMRTVYGSTGRLIPPASHEDDAEAENYKIRREVFVANYSQGVRVIDLKNLIKTPVAGSVSEENTSKKTIERAYFDFFPTLTYNKDDRYFYCLFSGTGYYDKVFDHINYSVTPAESVFVNTGTPHDDYYKGMLQEGNLYHGIWDVIPDVKDPYDSNHRPLLHTDENFVYASGISSEQGPYLKHAGFLILRYFRDELGGNITGYIPASTSSDMAFREVNLQGDFKVQRDVDIVAGTTLNLMPGKSNDDLSFESTSFKLGDYGSKIIKVHGTLNIGISDINPTGEDGSATTIKIDVPVEIEEGGVINIYPINSNLHVPVVFTNLLTIKSGGTLNIKPGSFLSINKVDNRGNIYAYGTSSKK